LKFSNEKEKREAVDNLLRELEATDNNNILQGRKESNFLQQLYEFSSLPQNKFLDFYTGMIEPTVTLSEIIKGNAYSASHISHKECKNLPAFKDWAAEGKISPVQSQVPCASSFLFAAVSAIESAIAIKYETVPVKLSNQHLLECVKNMTGNRRQGCDGGRPEWIWKYAKNQGGLVAESSYVTFNANPNNKCVSDLPKESKAAVLSWHKIYSEKVMKCHIALHGPLVAGISINNTSLRRFFTGIFDDIEGACTPDNPINHAVLIYGYGTEFNRKGEKMDYWLAQNSWGSSYGNKGNFKMARGENLCKIANDALFPVLQPKPSKPETAKDSLTFINPPNFCSKHGKVFRTDLYQKSFCVIEFLQTYENSQASCIKNNMKLYQVNSVEAEETILKVAKGIRKGTSLYVDGQNMSGCIYINNFNENPEIRFGDCKQAFYSVCEFLTANT
jgi:C1A family cysteine protease